MAPSTSTKHLVKRHGHTEKYDPKKVHMSVYAASLNCDHDGKKAKRIADSVTKKVNAWAKKAAMISSKDIRKKILDNLTDSDVALMYKHHLDVC